MKTKLQGVQGKCKWQATIHLISTVNVSGLTPSSENQTLAGWHLKTYVVYKTLLIMAIYEKGP